MLDNRVTSLERSLTRLAVGNLLQAIVILILVIKVFFL